MTGLDCLREEMERRGLNKSQIESKTAAVVLDILTESNGLYFAMVEKEAVETAKLRELRQEESYLQREISNKQGRIRDLEFTIKRIKEKAEQDQSYIDEFMNALLQCDTNEGKDALRRAQMFVNSIKVDSKYDNTAFITALGCILADGRIGIMKEIHKINPKIPVPDTDGWLDSNWVNRI